MAVGRRYITPVALTFNEALPEADLAEATAAKQHQQDDALLHHLTGRDHDPLFRSKNPHVIHPAKWPIDNPCWRKWPKQER